MLIISLTDDDPDYEDEDKDEDEDEDHLWRKARSSAIKTPRKRAAEKSGKKYQSNK